MTSQICLLAQELSLSSPTLWPLIPQKSCWEATMDKRSFMTGVAAALFAFVLSQATGHAAEVKVLTSVALKSVLDELAPAFETKTGNKLVIDYGLAAEQKKRIMAGERADLIILTRGMMEDLVKEKKLTTEAIVNVAG